MDEVIIIYEMEFIPWTSIAMSKSTVKSKHKKSSDCDKDNCCFLTNWTGCTSPHPSLFSFSFSVSFSFLF